MKIEFLSLKVRWFKCKVKNYILLYETYLNGSIESYFSFNFSRDLIYYSWWQSSQWIKKKINGEDTHEERVCEKKYCKTKLFCWEKNVFVRECYYFL